MVDKIAYLIAAHSDLEHLKRLINVLDYHADFFIHIDKKSDIDINDKFFQKPNVFVLSEVERVKVYWAGFSQVRATLRLIEKYLEISRSKKDPYLKVVFFSGSCYPIKSNAYIHNFFKQNKAVNFIKGMDVTTPNHSKYNYSLKRYHFFDMSFGNRNLTRIVRKALYFIAYFKRKENYYVDQAGRKRHLFHGSSWWALNDDVIQYIHQYHSNDTSLSKYLEYTMASDEKFFHTIFFNSPFASTNQSGGPDVFVPSTASFANLHIIDPSLTKWYDASDFDEIASSKQLFVRKVSTERSADLLDIIDQKLLK